MYPDWLKFDQWFWRGYRKCNKPLRRIDIQNGGQKWFSLWLKSSIDARFDKWSILCIINDFTILIPRLIFLLNKMNCIYFKDHIFSIVLSRLSVFFPTINHQLYGTYCNVDLYFYPLANLIDKSTINERKRSFQVRLV